jgi:hypothetical protein
MCNEMLVIPVLQDGGPNRIIGKKWRAKEEMRHKGLLTHKKLNSCEYVAKIMHIKGEFD